MLKITLRNKDGFAETRAWLRSIAKRFQAGLNEAGFPVGADGFFGPGSIAALKQFQAAQGLSNDGVAGLSSWNAMAPYLDRVFGEEHDRVSRLMPSFTGDLSWVHSWEGHQGKPYWPKGASGVTLDPGVDLGFAEPAMVEEIYRPLMSGEQWNSVKSVFGIRGPGAQLALKASPVLQTIRISRDQADAAMPFAAAPYWQKIADRFTVPHEPETPASVKTVLLSLAYNRGAGNKKLAVLRPPLEAKDWAAVAEVVGAMQQNHKLEGIRRRRRWEGYLIRDELASV